MFVINAFWYKNYINFPKQDDSENLYVKDKTRNIYSLT